MPFFTLSNPHLYIAIVLSVLNGILLCFAGYKFLQIIQLSGYKISGYNVWLKDTKGKYVSRICMLAFLSLACMLVFNCSIASINNSGFYFYIGLIFYVGFSSFFINHMFKAPKKTPLKTTRRMNRFIFLLFITISIITFFLIAFSISFIPYLHFVIIAGTPILLPILVPLVHFILIPFEHLVRIKYIKSAKRKLQKFPDLIKIGITGSYGKTSTKYILNTILSQSFNVCISPFSFNTPMGLTKVVHSYLKPEHEVLIAEMGARQVGDIAFLCDIIKPKYGILTSVGNQHLSTFFSIENITKTKYELIDSLPEDGLAIFNGDNEICVNLQKNCKKKSLLTAISNENAFAHAKNVTVGHKGISFTLCINSEEIDCCTKLLGLHNLENILLCCALASHLGLTLKQISKGISELKPISHRLEITSANGIHILDDSYNSSVKGSEAALNVLEMFPSKKKIIITPGLVELGGKEYAENFNFGKKMAKVASHVIVVNETHKEAISEGLLSEGFGQDKIIFAENLIAAQLQLKTIIKKGDIVLFENDLPDNYT